MSQEKDRLLARKARIEERLAAIAETESKRREKDDRRRAELAGKAVLKRARKDEAFAGQLRTILDGAITGTRNRALFDLPGNAGRGNGKASPPDSSAPPSEQTPTPRTQAANPSPSS